MEVGDLVSIGVRREARSRGQTQVMGNMDEGGLVAGHRCPSYSSPRTQASNSLSWVVSRYSLVCLPLPVNSAALGGGHRLWGLAT